MEGNHILLYLERSKKKGVMVSAFSNRHQPDKCSTGFIEEISNEQFIMKHVAPEGVYDGYIIRRINDIFRIDFNGKYEKRLALLYNLQVQHHKGTLKNKLNEDSNLFIAALVFAQNNNLIVRVCIDETEMQEDIVGFVKKVHDNVIISRITNEGLADGESIFRTSDIIKINIDSSDEKILKLLWLNQKNNQ